MKERKELKVRYYALFRELAGKEEETIKTLADTPREFYEELVKKYNFSLSLESIRVAVNNEFQDMDTKLHSGDNIIFIPPVSGG